MRNETSEAHRRTIRETLAYVERRLGRSVSLSQLAKRGGMAPHYFHRRFREIVGEPPSQYIKRLRLERAAFRARTSRRSVQALAREAGYASHEAFTRAFRDWFGLTPTDYRERGSRDGKARHPIPWSVKTLPERRVAYLRHVGPYDEIPRVVDKLEEWVIESAPGAGAFMIFFLDAQDITEADKTRCDVAVEIPSEVRVDGELQCRTLASGEFLVGRHARPYQTDELRQSYAYLLDEVISSLGREIGPDGGFETYPGVQRRPFEASPSTLFARALPSETHLHISLAPTP